MKHDWQELMNLTGGKAVVIERIKIPETGIAIEGEFEPPRMAMLPQDDLVFIAAFIRSHGSIKQMEKFFGVSYPTIKNRLNQIGEKMEFVEIEPARPRDSILYELERGNITVDEAIEMLNKGERNE
jgi:hypothetical protein